MIFKDYTFRIAGTVFKYDLYYISDLYLNTVSWYLYRELIFFSFEVMLMSFELKHRYILYLILIDFIRI